MTRLETGLLDLAESLLRNDDVVHDADYQTLYSIATDVGEVESENAKLRELVWDMYCLAYPSAVEWEVSDEAYDKYSPCEKCNELHGGKSPCASTAKDMTEECCEPIQAAVVADRMRELGVEVDDDCDLV